MRLSLLQNELWTTTTQQHSLTQFFLVDVHESTRTCLCGNTRQGLQYLRWMCSVGRWFAALIGWLLLTDLNACKSPAHKVSSFGWDRCHTPLGVPASLYFTRRILMKCLGNMLVSIPMNHDVMSMLGDWHPSLCLDVQRHSLNHQYSFQHWFVGPLCSCFLLCDRCCDLSIQRHIYGLQLMRIQLAWCPAISFNSWIPSAQVSLCQFDHSSGCLRCLLSHLCSSPLQEADHLLRRRTQVAPLTFTFGWDWHHVNSMMCNFCFSKLSGPNNLKSCVPGASCAKWRAPVFIQRWICVVLLSDEWCVDYGTHLQFPSAVPHCFNTVQIQFFIKSLFSTLVRLNELNHWSQANVSSARFNFPTDWAIIPLFCQFGLGNIAKPARGATYFGQFQLWPGLSSTLANFYFGQFLLWPIPVWPVLTLANVWANKKIVKKNRKNDIKTKKWEKHRENNTIRDGTNNIVRFHKKTAYARLLGFNKPSCGASPAEGRRCSTLKACWKSKGGNLGV